MILNDAKSLGTKRYQGFFVYLSVRNLMEYYELSEFQVSYLETLLWSTGDLEVDEFYFDSADALVFTSEVDLKDKSTVQHLESVAEFYNKYRGIWYGYWLDNDAAHDLALTRNSHGAGFWDRYYSSSVANLKSSKNAEQIHAHEGYVRGQILSKAAKLEGSCGVLLLSPYGTNYAQLYDMFRRGIKVFNRYQIP